MAAIALEAITLFRRCGTRAANDGNNKMREKILEALCCRQIPDTYFTQDTYGTEWTRLRDEWKTSLESLCPLPYDTLSLERKGGRGFNYDFLARFLENEREVWHAKIEFKHGVARITALPQILSLDATSNFVGTSYAEFYYDTGYLADYLAADGEFPLPILDRATWLHHIRNINYDCNPFFRALKEREHIHKAAKTAIVNRSIEEYLNGLTPDLATLTQHLLASQKDKHYLLWDTQTFHTDRLSDEDLTLSEFVAEHRNKKNTLVVASDTMTYRCLLRWRNHKGILKPAWQISVKRNVT